MPAITVDDVESLPRITGGEQLRDRPIRSITAAPKGYEGEGFPVRRAFTGVDLADLDPFVHLDQIGEVDYAPGEPKGHAVAPPSRLRDRHLHDGRRARHADSTGGGGVIRDGGTQWMTAGNGILHIETPPHDVVTAGGWFHGLQLWVNLPKAKKWVDPRYQDLAGEQVTVVTTPAADTVLRVIAGDVGGHAGPGSTHTPMAMVHATLAPGARAVVPWTSSFNCRLRARRRRHGRRRAPTGDDR